MYTLQENLMGLYKDIGADGCNPELVDRFGRPINSKLDRVLYVAGDINFSNRFSNGFSFDESVYSDIQERVLRIKKRFNLENLLAYSFGNIVWDDINRKFSLDSPLILKHELFEQIRVTGNFLQQVVFPTKIIGNDTYIRKFLDSIGRLKSAGIGIRDIFEMNGDFNKSYNFEDYLEYREGNLKYLRDKETVQILSDNYPNLLIDLCGRKLVSVNFDEIGKIKKDYVKDITEKDSFDKKKGLDQLRQFIKHEEREETHSVVLIKRNDSAMRILSLLTEKQILDYFPFDSRFDRNFLIHVVKDLINK